MWRESFKYKRLKQEKKEQQVETKLRGTKRSRVRQHHMFSVVTEQVTLHTLNRLGRATLNLYERLHV